MKDKRICLTFLFLLLILCSCGIHTDSTGGISRENQAPSSVASGSLSESASSCNESSLPSGLLSSAGPARPDSSAAASAPGSQALPSASSYITPASSLPPLAAPAPAAKAAAVPLKMPQASGTHVFSQSGCSADFSNSAEGYIMVKYGGSSRLKVLVYYNDSSTYYQYSIAGDDSYVTLPLQSGSGSYRVRFMENIPGSGNYAELCSTVLSASVSGFGYTLYPNQYVNYTASSSAVAKAKSLCANTGSNAGKADAIYRYITANIKYDTAKAGSVKSGYLPDVDSTLSTRRGICFDYAALMAAMCRSQGVPARLVIGDTTAGYHAWNEIYLNGWKRYDSTFGAAGQTAGNYTPQKYY